MSTLKVNSIKSPSSSTGGIEINSSGNVTGALPYPNRNLLYNGAMQVAQRGTSATGITASGYYTADRWSSILATMGTWTQTVEADGPSGSGFTKSIKMLCTTADSSPAAADRVVVRQLLEGQDLQRIKKGTSSAEQLTISFWVKSNVTGTYVVVLIDGDNNRHVAATYSVATSATWEKKTITFPADTTGALDNDNATSFQVQFWLGAGTDWSSGTLPTTWATNVGVNNAVGQTNLAAATNNYWQITGVQLEVGDTATEFEHLPYGVELARCERYFQTIKPFGNSGTFVSTTECKSSFPFTTVMRAAPSVTIKSATYTDLIEQTGIALRTPTSITANYAGTQGIVLIFAGMSGATRGDGAFLRTNLGDDTLITVSAEL